MKFFILLLTLALSSVITLNADELSNAYQKEYTFLKAQKDELGKRKKQEQSFQEKEISKIQKKVNSLQERYVNLSETVKNYEIKIDKSNETLGNKTSNKEITNSVIIQAKSLLGDYNINVNDSEKAVATEVMKKAFIDAANLYKTLSSIQSTDGKFYLVDGTTAEGKIVKVGNIAAYGISNKVSAALAPAGNGEYKAWNVNTSKDAQAFNNSKHLKDLNIFVYENLDKDVEYIKEKTMQDTLDGGGTIGYIILALGILGLVLLIARVFLLTKSGSNVNVITGIVLDKVEQNKADEAYGAIEHFKGSTARVIRATLRNINKEREHIEDIVMESILNESSNIDKFGNFVLVLAAVAPLLGLLGTVTGMIATFDIITEHGTGDPKLLSGGISEALVTTMFGLIVAIPLLLVGNLLSGWAQNIKDSMEQSALHIVNIFEKQKA